MASARIMRSIHHSPVPERSRPRGAEGPGVIQISASVCVSRGVPTAGPALARWPSIETKKVPR